MAKEITPDVVKVYCPICKKKVTLTEIFVVDVNQEFETLRGIDKRLHLVEFVLPKTGGRYDK